MRTSRADLVVAGAGPVGSTVARLCAEGGLSVVLLEEHASVGRPVQCAGLVSTRLPEVNALPAEVVVNSVRGAHMRSPGGVGITVSRPAPQALVLDRAAYDAHLAGLAEDAGAELVCGARVASLGPGLVSTADAAWRARFVACCDGFASRLARGLGLDTSRELLPACHARVRVAGGLEQDHVSMFFGRSLAPGFFGWVIPESGTVARVGVACRGQGAPARLRHLLRTAVGAHTVLERGGGLIPLSGPIRRAHEGAAVVVGDAAGQTKATTGGGIVTGSMCAAAAAEAILADDPASYERGWRRRVGRELSAGLRVRRFVDALDDAELDELFRVIKGSGAERIIERWGDMDFPTALLARCALHPPLAGFVLRRLWGPRRAGT